MKKVGGFNAAPPVCDNHFHGKTRKNVQVCSFDNQDEWPLWLMFWFRRD